MTEVISMLIGSVNNQSDHLAKMDQLYSIWCKTEKETEAGPGAKENQAKSEEGLELAPRGPDPKSQFKEEVQLMIFICAPIITTSVLLMFFIRLVQACKGRSPAQIEKIHILPITNENEIFYKDNYPKTLPIVQSTSLLIY